MIGRGGATDTRQLAISLHRGRRGIASRPRVWLNHVHQPTAGAQCSHHQHKDGALGEGGKYSRVWDTKYKFNS